MDKFGLKCGQIRFIKMWIVYRKVHILFFLKRIMLKWKKGV